MFLLIPQVALDSLVCDYCHKYLSVTPVKVFLNRTIKCGRCVLRDDDNDEDDDFDGDDDFDEDEDSGVSSMYNEVAKRSIFKCINHYEGCKVMLNTREAFQHEAICESREYVCPICSDLTPSYLIFKHFINKHKELVLKNSNFVIKQSTYTDLHFLYRYENYLLFVKYSHEIFPNDDHIKGLIRFSLIGDSKTVRSLDMDIDIVLSFGKTKMEKKVKCNAFPSDGSNDLKFNLDLKFENMLNVTFSLEVPKSDVSIQMAAIPINKYQCSHLSNEYLSVLLLSRYFKDRNIYLNTDIKYKCSEGVILNDVITKIESISEMSDVKLTCYICSLAHFCHIKGEILVVKNFGKYSFICYFCLRSHDYLKYYLAPSYLENVSYYCKWMCGSRIKYNNLLEHENHCKNQIPQPCPVKNCQHHCRSFKLKEHFRDQHPYWYTPVFKKNVNVLLLTPSSSPIELVYVVSNISIVIELTFNYSSSWKINLSCKILNARPRMVILDSSGEFVTFINEKGSCKNLNRIEYLCYLADPAKEEFEKKVKQIG